MSRSSFDSAALRSGRTGVQSERLCTFLQETLELWGVAGAVEAGEAPVVAVIRAESGAIVWVERPRQTARPEGSAAESKGEPPLFRWAVRWRAARDAPGGTREVRPRLCGSVNGVLSAMRRALNVDRGTPLRIAASPDRNPS